jgi:hypothetical protein
LLDLEPAMASPIRRLEVVPAAPTGEAAELAARLARVEAEAAALRDEVAALREDLEWLAGLDEEPELAAARGNVFTRGWLATGWARASLVLASLGLVMVVSVPYLMHLLGPAGADPLPVVAELAPRPAEPAPADAAEVAPARLSRAAAPKVRSAVARSRARVRAEAPAAGPAPLPESR